MIYLFPTCLGMVLWCVKQVDSGYSCSWGRGDVVHCLDIPALLSASLRFTIWYQLPSVCDGSDGRGANGNKDALFLFFVIRTLQSSSHLLLPPAVSPPPATLHTVATGTNLHTATPCPKTGRCVCPTVLRGNLQMEVGSPGSSNPPSSGLDLLTRSYQTISTVPWCLVAGTPEYAGRPVAGVGAIIGTPCTQWGRPWPPLSPPPSSQPSLLCPLQQRRSESLQSEFVRKRCKFVPASANINHAIEL